MTIETSDERFDNLKGLNGTIGIEGENGEEIVVRIVFDDPDDAEYVYYRLFDMD